MPRYELGSKFWEVVLQGLRYTFAFGQIGKPGQTRIKKFTSSAAAKAAYDEAIEEKLEQGYALVEPAKKAVVPAKGGDARLEAAIDADPNDVDAYSVYADHLQSVGDPRGELIALSLANKQAAVRKLIDKQTDYFLGPLAPHRLCYDFVYLPRKKGQRKQEQIREEAFIWKYGFIHALRLNHNQYAEDVSNPPFKLETSLADVLAAVIEHPSGRFVSEISIKFNDDPSGNLQDIVDVLAKRAPKTIRKLHLGDYTFAGGYHAKMAGHDTEISWYSVGNLGKLWKAVPGLRHLITQGGAAGHAQGGGMQLGTIDLPNLVHAEFRSGGTAKANARAIAKAKIPNIEHLDIWYGDPTYGGDATIKDAQLLLQRTDLPRLRHLGLRNSAFADALPAVIAQSKLLPKLVALDLSLGTMTDEGARMIAANRSAFAHLERLDVHANYLTKEGLRLLKGAAKKVVLGEQRVDEYGRYPAVNE